MAADETHTTTHLVIPDTQVAPGVPTEHLSWLGQYIVDRWHDDNKFKIVHLGDHADMSSLSSYDKKGSKTMEGQRYLADIDAANKAFDKLNAPLIEFNRKRRKNKERQWWPERHVLIGNHENRITRAIEDEPKLDGILSLDHLNYKQHGWQVHEFLHILWLDGVAYSHYFYQPNSGRPYSGMAETRLKSIGHTFVQGHQQGLQIAQRSVAGGRQRAIIAGSAYLHNEDYRGPQATDEWRGVLVLHQVAGGNFDVMEVSLDFLARRYEGTTLEKFMRRKYPQYVTV